MKKLQKIGKLGAFFNNFFIKLTRPKTKVFVANQSRSVRVQKVSFGYKEGFS